MSIPNLNGKIKPSWREDFCKEFLLYALKRRTKVAVVAMCTALAATTVTPAVAQPQNQSSMERIVAMSEQMGGLLSTGVVFLVWYISCTLKDPRTCSW